MKKVLLFLVALFVLSARGACADEVGKNFYLGGAEREKHLLLPNTLRTELFVGESQELFVEVHPEKGAASISWELKNDDGTVSLFPSGEKCTVLANIEGEETILVHLRGGRSTEISVTVNPAPEIKPRTFEVEEKSEKREALLAKILKFVLCGLTSAGAGLVLFAVIFFIRRRKK